MCRENEILYPVPLIHCWGCNRNFWENQVAEFSKTHRVVTIRVNSTHLNADRSSFIREDFQNALSLAESRIGITRDTGNALISNVARAMVQFEDLWLEPGHDVARIMDKP